MADEFNTGTNWWDSTRNSTTTNNRFDSTAGSSSSSPSGLNNSLGSFGWATEMVDIKTAAAAARSSMDSVSSVSGTSVVFQDTQKLQGGPVAGDFHMIGLGLSSQAMDWNQALL